MKREPTIIITAVIAAIEAILALLIGFEVIKMTTNQFGLVMSAVIAVGGVIQALLIKRLI